MYFSKHTYHRHGETSVDSSEQRDAEHSVTTLFRHPKLTITSIGTLRGSLKFFLIRAYIVNCFRTLYWTLGTISS